MGYIFITCRYGHPLRTFVESLDSKLRSCRRSRHSQQTFAFLWVFGSAPADVRFSPGCCNRLADVHFGCLQKLWSWQWLSECLLWMSARLFSAHSRHKTQQISTLTWILPCVWYSSLSVKACCFKTCTIQPSQNRTQTWLVEEAWSSCRPNYLQYQTSLLGSHH